MVVIPFPTSRFTKGDVTAIVELCYRMTSLAHAGGWARHTSDQGADILCILNVHNDNAKYVFDRTQEGSYRLYGADGRVLAVTETIDELLAAIHVDSPPSGGGVRLKKAP